MHLRYWGDSYDLVKQSLLRWLRPLGDWSVHPMFTEHVALEQTEQFAAFLAARLLSGAVLTSSTNRADYLACASGCSNLFLDPDTGLWLKSMRGKRAPQFLFAGELV